SLNSQALKLADSAGLFDRAIIDILRVRKEVKELVLGKFLWQGAQCFLPVYNQETNRQIETLEFLIQRPAALFGATFAIINPEHENLHLFVNAKQQQAVAALVKTTKQRSLISRYENPDITLIPSGCYIINPFTKEKMPLLVGDYTVERYETRISKTHLAIPAHDIKDFEVAEKYNLDIKLVITALDGHKSSSPQIHPTTQKLLTAYPGEYSDCVIINSDFLNGSIRTAHNKALTHLQDLGFCYEYKQPIVYQFMNKSYSINDLQALETLLMQEHKTLTNQQKDDLLILMMQAQRDFLHIVEHFLINAREAKELMIDLIQESCTLRKNKDAYLLYWVNLKTNESEKVIFKRDINSFYKFCKFCAELIDFLGDFGSSCTHALENLKNISNNQK
ncbi:class I tRNA ligase family protein, partial [Candidatus Babeliales bacterium]|nr:class I tRNA ligase family protein [Candidatus Babeliales bacterium]